MREKFLRVLTPEATEVCTSLNKVLEIARSASFDAHDLRTACQQYTVWSDIYESKLAAMEQFLKVVGDS